MDASDVVRRFERRLTLLLLTPWRSNRCVCTSGQIARHAHEPPPQHYRRLSHQATFPVGDEANFHMPPGGWTARPRRHGRAGTVNALNSPLAPAAPLVRQNTLNSGYVTMRLLGDSVLQLDNLHTASTHAAAMSEQISAMLTALWPPGIELWTRNAQRDNLRVQLNGDPWASKGMDASRSVGVAFPSSCAQSLIRCLVPQSYAHSHSHIPSPGPVPSFVCLRGQAVVCARPVRPCIHARPCDPAWHANPLRWCLSLTWRPQDHPR